MTNDWHDVELENIGEVITGKTPPTARTDYFGGDIPFITPTDMDGRRMICVTERYLSDAGKSAVARAVIPPGAVLVSCIGSDMGKAAIAGRTSVTNQQINSLIVSEPNSGLYVYYNLSSRRDELRGLAAGSAQPILNKTSFSRLRLRLPPPSEQEAIAAVLGALDDKIEQNRRTSRALEKLARAAFKAWFVDFEPVKAKAAGQTSFPGMSAAVFAATPEGLIDSPLGPVPEGWTIGKVSDLGDVVCGKTPPTSDPANYGDDVDFITIPEMHGKVFVSNTARKLSLKGANSQRNKFVPARSIAVSCIATPGLVVMTAGPAQTNQQINTVVPHQNCDPYFCYEILLRLGDQIRAGGSGGSVFHNLNKSGFEAIAIPIPSQELISGYGRSAKPLFDAMLAAEAEISKLAALRDYLLPRLLSGRVRVKGGTR